MKAIFAKLGVESTRGLDRKNADSVKQDIEKMADKSIDGLKTCVATYMSEKLKLQDEIQQCIKTSPDSRENCFKDRLDRFLTLKEQRQTCLENQMASFFSEVRPRIAQLEDVSFPFEPVLVKL